MWTDPKIYLLLTLICLVCIPKNNNIPNARIKCANNKMFNQELKSFIGKFVIYLLLWYNIWQYWKNKVQIKRIVMTGTFSWTRHLVWFVFAFRLNVYLRWIIHFSHGGDSHGVDCDNVVDDIAGSVGNADCGSGRLRNVVQQIPDHLRNTPSSLRGLSKEQQTRIARIVTKKKH